MSTRAANIQRRPHTRNLETIAAGKYSLDDAYLPFQNDPNTFEPVQSTPSPPLPRQDVLEHLSDFEPEIKIQDEVSEITSEQAKIAMFEKLEEEAARMQSESSLLQSQPSADSIVVPDGRLMGGMPQIAALEAQKLDIILPERTRVDRRKDRKARRMKAKKAIPSVLDPEEQEVKNMLFKVQQPRVSKPRKAKAENKALVTTTTTSKKLNSLKPTIKPVETTPVQSNKKEPWQSYKAALKEKFGEQAWSPRKRISPDALAGIRALRTNQPDVYTTDRLAEHFKMSPEAIRRILRSKWQPNEEEMDERRKRWEKRGVKKWAEMAEEGVRPPKKWRELGVGRTEDGQAPKWKRTEFDGKVRGERWIEQPATDVFVRAADAESETSADTSIAERIL